MVGTDREFFLLVKMCRREMHSGSQSNEAACQKCRGNAEVQERHPGKAGKEGIRKVIDAPWGVQIKRQKAVPAAPVLAFFLMFAGAARAKISRTAQILISIPQLGLNQIPKRDNAKTKRKGLHFKRTCNA